LNYAWGKDGLGSSRGQISLELIAPLLLLLSILVIFAFVIPDLTPRKVIVFGVGFAVFVVSFTSTQFALYILIFSMLLSPELMVGTTEGAAALGRGITVRLDDFMLVVIGFSWLARMAINKELGLFLRTPLNKPIAYYLLVCMISTLMGAIFGRVDLKTGFFFVLKYFEYVIVYFMVVNHLKDKNQVRNYLVALLITCAISSIIGIRMIPSGERISAPFEGTRGEPNTFGGYLVFMICIAIGLLQTTSSLRNRLMYGLLIVLFAIPLFYTQSRSSYIAAIPAIVSFVWLSKKKHWVIPLVLLFGFSLPYIAPRSTKQRIAYTFTQGLNRKDVVEVYGVKLDTSSSARLMSWKEAASDWIEHPILGYGVTGYQFVDAQYVRAITETGFLGLFFFLLLLYAIFKESRRVLRSAEDPLYQGLAAGFLAGFIGLLFHATAANTFIIVRIMEPFWFTAGMVMMLPQIEKSRAILQEREPLSRRLTPEADSEQPEHPRL
jgi:O-antigen ligase